MTDENPIHLWLCEEAAELIRGAASSALPDETGGVLIGVSVDERPWVTDAVLVPSPKSSPVYYELTGEARRAAVDGARDRDLRLGYIGEWHSHTYDIGPSGLDRETMASLAENESDSPDPVLVIARLRAGAHILEAHQQVAGRLMPRSMIATGPLVRRPLELDGNGATDG